MSSPFSALVSGRRVVLRFVARIVPVTLLGAFALSHNAFATDLPLTLAQARHLAIERSRQLAGQDHAVAAARDMAVAAGQLPDPVLKAGVDNLPVTRTDRFSLTNDFMTMRRVGVMQEITRIDKRRLRGERFEREAEKSLAEKDVAAAAIERDTALAWLDRYYAEAMAAVFVEQGAQAQLEMQAAEGAYRSGRGMQADLYVARSALASFDDRASELQLRVRNAKAMLARWVGPAAALPLAGKPSVDTIGIDAANLEAQFAHHPQIAVLAKQEEIAQTEARLAQANKKADWSVEVAFQQRGPAYANMISVGVAIPLQWDQKHRQDRELSSKLSLVEQARAEREETLRAHVAETRTMINEWESKRERSARYGRELIPFAQQRTSAVLTAYRGGKASLPEVLAARRGEIDVRLQALQLDAETARLWAQLNFLFPQNGASAHSHTMKQGTQ
ncbi:TolC family protein [Massilia sp. TWR1-2-2]|uniref:TolC family protein n=1 Tax=Massilia sp. TWR1-2-2 TaxID=2804584 RepID=UPI003CF24886